MNETIQRALDALRRSSFRSRFRLGTRERSYIAEKGLDTIRRHAEEMIAARVGPAEPKNDGRQTPMRGHPVFIAQHATGSCCRGCIEKWHGIPRGKPLTPEERSYLTNLIMAWIETELERET